MQMRLGRNRRLKKYLDDQIRQVPPPHAGFIMKLKHLRSFPGKHMVVFYEKLHEDSISGDTGFKLNTCPSVKVPTSAEYATDKDVAELVNSTIKYITSRFCTSMEPPLSYFIAMNVTMWPYDHAELVDYGVGNIAVLVNHYRMPFTEEEVDNISLNG